MSSQMWKLGVLDVFYIHKRNWFSKDQLKMSSPKLSIVVSLSKESSSHTGSLRPMSGVPYDQPKYCLYLRTHIIKRVPDGPS